MFLKKKYDTMEDKDNFKVILYLLFIISNSLILFMKLKFLYYNINIDYNQSEIFSYLISFFFKIMQKSLYTKKIVFYSF